MPSRPLLMGCPYGSLWRTIAGRWKYRPRNQLRSRPQFHDPYDIACEPEPSPFRRGGNGTGTAVYLIGNELVLYQDQASGTDTVSTLDITSLAGQYVTIRLDADYSQAAGSDSINLFVLSADGSQLAATNTGLSFTTLAGGDGTGVGGSSSTLAGTNENATITSLDNGAAWALAAGLNVLDATQITGTLNTGTMADTQRLTPPSR